jgi:hypothetical protein
MYREKAFPIGALLLVVVVAAALMGVGYGLWSKTLDIGGTVETGEVNAEFVLGAVTEEDHGKDVGDCTAALLDPETLEVTVSNGYPSYECWVDFQVRNPGGIPIHIYQPDFTSLPPSTEVTVDSTACYDDDLQVHEGESSPVCTIHVHVEQGGAQNATYTFAATVEARQFNEPRCDPDLLIQQIEAANADPGPDTIDLHGSCTYALTEVYGDYDGPTGLPSITSDITINGNGATIERSSAGGTPTFRIMHVASGGDLTLNDITIQHGLAQSPNYNGGGIYTLGNLTLNAVTLHHNISWPNGGGVYNGGTLTVADSTFTDNNSAFGGGIMNGGTATVSRTVLSGNSAYYGGGGIENNGTLDIIDSAIIGNTISLQTGGGIRNRGQMTITGSTISGNTAPINGGGGIYTQHYYQQTTLTITNSTISGNSAATGGGLDSYNSIVTLVHVTVVNNDAGTGGGILSESGATVDLTNTIVANNGVGADCSGPVISSGHNLDSDNTCGLTGSGDLPNTDPLLGSLANNGGPTWTHALLSGSPAIDAGDDTVCPATDQRGVTRPQGPHCDIGAFELEIP